MYGTPSSPLEICQEADILEGKDVYIMENNQDLLGIQVLSSNDLFTTSTLAQSVSQQVSVSPVAGSLGLHYHISNIISILSLSLG